MESENKKAVKAGVYYTICNFATNGLYLLTTPIYTRLLSQEGYGVTATYNTWMALFTIICTLDLYSCIQISRVDFENKSREFLSSILSLSSISIFIFYILFKLVDFVKPDILGMPVILYDILFLEILCRNVVTLFQQQNSAYLKYKEYIIVSMIIAFSGQLLSVLLVMQMRDGGYLGKIIGTSIPYFIVGIIIASIIMVRGKTVYNREYWKYGLKISVPLIPHHIAGSILTQFDRIVINMLVGLGATALYSLASNYALIVQVVWNSFNSAWVPWFYGQMKEDNISDIKYFVKIYAIGMSVVIVIAALIGPEAIFILGGAEYADSAMVIPSFLLGIFFQFLYSLYVNIEFYYKKTKKLAVWTLLAAMINLVLNYALIPYFGYVAAGYTTLFSYFCLFIFHYRTAKKYEERDIYDLKNILYIAIGLTIIVISMHYIYHFVIIRYVLLLGVSILFVLYCLKHRKEFIKMLNGGK